MSPAKRRRHTFDEEKGRGARCIGQRRYSLPMDLKCRENLPYIFLQIQFPFMCSGELRQNTKRFPRYCRRSLAERPNLKIFADFSETEASDW